MLHQAIDQLIGMTEIINFLYDDFDSLALYLVLSSNRYRESSIIRCLSLNHTTVHDRFYHYA
jgi:hypothetical protein